MEFTVEEHYKDWRLDKFLNEKISHISRSQIQKAIKNGLVLVNNQKVSKHFFLSIDDKIILQKEIEPNKIITTLEPNKKITFQTVYQDENYLVINKPAGIIIHPGDTHPEQNTLANGIIAKYPEIAEVGEDRIRPGIVHRLDKEVSGLMVIARTQIAFLDLKKQFQNRSIYKEYTALVHGKTVKQNDVINFSIERSKTSGHKMAARPDDSGREAITEYDVIKEYNNYTLLKVVIHTGRTHQIRVHLNAIGYPIVGDNVYKPNSLKTNVQLDRIFLHSTKLKFTNLDGEEIEFEIPLPEKLQALLDTIK